MTAKLIKTTKVVKAIFFTGSAVSFGYKDEDTGENVHLVILNMMDYEDMGKPTHLTVTIEPGDLLSD